MSEKPSYEELEKRIRLLQEEALEDKRIERTLKIQKAYLERILDCAPEAIVLADKRNRIIRANTQFTRLFGFTSKEASGRTCDELIASGEKFKEASEVTSRVSRGEAIRIETTRYRKDGTPVCVELMAAPVRVGKKHIGDYASYRDVTERKGIMNALRESEKLLALTQRLAKIGGWEWDVKAQTMAWTAEVYRIHDFEPNEIQPLSQEHIARSLECYDKEDRPVILAAFESCAEHGRPYDLEFPFTTARGSRLWIRTAAQPILEEGRVVKVVGHIMDISERKRAEEALKESLQTSVDIVQAIPAGLFIYKFEPPDHLFLMEGNPEAERLTDMAVHEWIGKEFNEIWPEAGTTGITEAFLEVLRTGETLETEDLHYEDKRLKGAFRVRAFRIPKGRLAVAFENISERKRAEEERRKLQAQLNQAQRMESVGRLAGGVAHDFNNMLQAILGHTELAMSQVEPTQPVFADLQEIRKSAERSADLVRQLLAFARRQTISPRVIDLDDTVEGMLKMLRRIIGEDIDLIWLPGKHLWPVEMDPSQVDQVLANLCVNARDAISGVGKITIETGAVRFDETYCSCHGESAPGDYVLLAVNDNGCGMDAEMVSHVFEPFFTTKETGKGTGLGLATIYGIVKQNRGFIHVYSEPGLGTSFKVYLPRYKGMGKRSEVSGAEEPGRGGSETVLVVEDEPAILTVSKTMLEKLGYTVVAAKKPGEAIRLAEAHPGEIDLLITDVVMPEMNGLELAENLLSLYANLKCLFMSGYTADVIAHHGVLDKGVHFIQKPFSMGHLAVKVRDALENT